MLRAPSIVQEVGLSLWLPRFHPATAHGKLAGPCVPVYPGNNPRDAREVPIRQIPCQIEGPSPEPGGMFPIFLASPKTPRGGGEGQPPYLGSCKM